MTRALRIILPFTLLLATAGVAQQHPNIERGFLPDKSYQLGDVDTINLFNGTLNLSIPLGMRYPVNGSLSYQFVLSYATNGWEVGEHEVIEYIDRYPYELRHWNRWSYPARRMNAGFGWLLNFGRMFKNDGQLWMYQSPDGGQHGFGKLHKNNPNETLLSGVSYTSDGTYLRLRTYADRLELDFPNGEIHKFDMTGRLTTMTDAFENSVSIAYGVRTGTYAGSPKWTISDSTGRTHYVYFRPGPSYTELFFDDTAIHDRIDYLDLATYDDPTVSNDGRAEYHFEYATDGNGSVPDSVLISRRCPQTEPELSETVRVALLEGIQMPEGLRYEMDYDRGSQSFCSQLQLDGTGSASGNLTQVRLTTGATVDFTYRVYDYPVASAFETPPFGGDPAETMYFSTLPGIKSRIVKEGNTVLADTEYEPDRFDQGLGEQAQKRIVRHRNGQAVVDEVHHYFTTCVVLECGNATEYGLPLSRVGMPANGPFISTETFVPNAAGSLVLGRSSWLIYETDGNILTFSGSPGDYNRRVRYSKTIFEDGTFTEAASAEFDGLGQYRTTISDGTLAEGNNLRTTFTNFNPSRGTFNVAVNGSYFGTFTMPPVNGPWILGTYDVQRTTENGQTSTMAACFDADGFLTGRRAYAAFGETPSRQAKDLLAIFTPDGNGNLSFEQYLGGDVGVPASTGATCLASSSTDNYRIKHHYASGVRKASYFTVSGSTPYSHFILDTDVDHNSGLVTARREASTVGSGGATSGDGLKTVFKYDALGRLVLETPDPATTNRGARRRVAFSRSSTKVDIFEENTAGTQVLRTRTFNLDGLGRAKKETRSIAGGSSATAFRTWEYDGVGRPTSASTWGNQASSVLTQFEYDPYGRVKTVTAPDGVVATYSYTGVRQSSATTSVRTSNSTPQNTNATTISDYDHQGRLLRVTDPAGVKTKYQYDVGGRLIHVCADETAGCVQNRSFTYDNRGFMTGEQTPELGTGGNGSTSYLYDAKGNVVQTTIGAALGAFDVQTEYDRAGRAKRIYEAGSGRNLKMFEYGTGNSSGGYEHGRLTRAVRYNWFDSLGYNVQVIEDYTYAGREGRVSNRVTYDRECLITGLPCNTLFAGNPKRRFTQNFSYDELGAVTSMDQPSCTIGDCAAAGIPNRSITNGYDKGWLTSVAWTSAPQAASIAYHDNGMIQKVTHANQVVDEILLDALRIPRPHEIKTTNVVDPATCTLPTFTTQPQSLTITYNTFVDLTAKAEGQAGAAITYQWYRGTYPDSSALVKTEILTSGVMATFRTPNLTLTTPTGSRPRIRARRRELPARPQPLPFAPRPRSRHNRRVTASPGHKATPSP